MHREHDSTPWLLEQWARWAWIRRGLHLQYPSMTPFRRLAKTDQGPDAMLSDTCCEAIDAAVARVASGNRECGEVLIRSYLLGQSYRKIERDAGISKSRVGPLLRLGEAAVSEILDAE